MTNTKYERQRAPAKTRSRYEPIYCKKIVEFMKDGATLNSFAKSIGVGRRTIDDWAQNIPEFALAKEHAVTAAMEHWLSIGESGIKGQIKCFSASAWTAVMAARFGFYQGGRSEEAFFAEPKKVSGEFDQAEITKYARLLFGMMPDGEFIQTVTSE